MIAILARLAAAFTAVGTVCYVLSAFTGWPGFEQAFWGVVVLALIFAGVLAAFAGLVLGAVWLLLSDRSPIPAVRRRWTRHLTPLRAAGQTARRTATTQKGTS